MIELQEITTENHIDTRNLTVHSSQERFVATVDKSLADAYIWKEAQVRVATDDGVTVGFVMIFPYDSGELREVNIVSLLVDSRFQQMGIGRQILEATLDWIKSLSPTVNRIRISTFPENAVALNLYKSSGFSGDEIEDGEVVLYRRVTDDG
jgi:diamine N-acetyltransferase